VKDMRTEAARTQRDNALLQALAHTDPLTGLLNRRGLDAALATALQAARPGQPTAVFLLDLDGFKAINDDLGHEVGDALLVAVGARLRSQVRAGDAVARPGGDEFVVVVPMLPGNEEAARLGHKLLDCIAAPFSVAGHECHVGVTAGYVVAPFDGLDPASLLRRADAAMYAGKQAGRNCLQRGSAALELARRPGPREQARLPQQTPQ
jgi:diguanylate cyclase